MENIPGLQVNNLGWVEGSEAAWPAAAGAEEELDGIDDAESMAAQAIAGVSGAKAKSKAKP